MHVCTRFYGGYLSSEIGEKTDFGFRVVRRPHAMFGRSVLYADCYGHNAARRARFLIGFSMYLVTKFCPEEARYI